MRILITGAAGFLGRNMLLAIPSSWQVVAVYRPTDKTFPTFVEAHQLRHVYPVACDLSNAAQVERVGSQVGRRFDSCLYLAANTSVPLSIQRPVEDLEKNVGTLLQVLQGWSFDHLVYLSSGAVYLGLSGLVGPESPVAPTLPYAISKMAAEQYIRAFATYHQTPAHATIIRFFGAFGPFEPSRKLYTKLVHRFAFERHPQFTVLGDGENYIDAMYVEDAVKALLAVLTTPACGVRTVDLGLGNRESVNQVVTRAAHAFGLEPHIAHEGQSPEYITFTIDPQPFLSLYHVTPSLSLEEGLQRLAAHLQREGLLEQK